MTFAVTPATYAQETANDQSQTTDDELEQVAAESKQRLEQETNKDQNGQAPAEDESTSAVADSDASNEVSVFQSKNFFLSAGLTISSFNKSGDLHELFDEQDEDGPESNDFNFTEYKDKSAESSKEKDYKKGMGALYFGLEYYFPEFSGMRFGVAASMNAFGYGFEGRNKNDNYKFRVSESLLTTTLSASLMIALDEAESWKLGLMAGGGPARYKYEAEYVKILDDVSSDFMDAADRDKKPSGSTSGTTTEFKVFLDALRGRHGARIGLHYTGTTLGKVDYGAEELSVELVGYGLFMAYRFAF